MIESIHKQVDGVVENDFVIRTNTLALEKLTVDSSLFNMCRVEIVV